VSAAWAVEVLLVGTGYSSTCTLLRSREHRIVIDTGLSIQEDALAAALNERGVSPDDIDLVINTHLHVDHCGNNSLFRAATILASRAEWDWTHAFYAAVFNTRAAERMLPTFYPEIGQYNLQARTIRNVARLARLFWRPERLGDPSRIRWLETTGVPAGLTILATPGHTPHHLSVHVNAPEPVVVAGDAVLAEDADAKVRTMIPFSRAQFLDTREHLLKRGERIVPGHGPAFTPSATQPAATPRDARRSRP
jgi:glyoxylase-like metal-dependent hydrolase (beta-lactamase superfamily II)